MIKFELSRGLILLPLSVRYNGIQLDLKALVDTGSGGTALDINLVSLNRHCQSRIVEVAGVGGNQDVIIHQTESVKFCGYTVSKFEVEFGDIASKFGFDAIVGSDLLDRLGICINYKQHEIGLGV